MKARSRATGGFTLVETLVALALIAVIVVTILSAFASVTIAATHHQQQASLDRLTRSDAEFIKSQAYIPKGTGTYANITATGYTFSLLVLYYDPATGTFSSALPDNRLQQIQLTASAPGGGVEKLIFLKVQP